MIFHSCKAPITPQKGYALLILMLIIAGLGVYFAYQLSIKTLKTQAWQIQKTATEVGYWFDVEQNYLQDNGTSSLSSISLSSLQQDYFLPYGLTEKNTFSLSTPISEFLCSALPGINTEDGNNLSLNGTSITTDCSGSNPACKGLNFAYYSCGTAPARAQYYVNANYIYLNPPAVGLGLIVRAPQTSNTQTLADNSMARHLISLLPTSNANIYNTGSSNVQGVGIGSYAIPPTGTTIVDNNRYNKIIDMGLVQTSDLNHTGSLRCVGWTGSQKTGTGGLNGDNTNNKDYEYEPPTCIRITPKNHPTCKAFDILYAMYRSHTDAESTNTGLVGFTNKKTYVSKNGDYEDVYLSIFSVNRGGDSGYRVSRDQHKDNWLIYLVRCRQAAS